MTPKLSLIIPAHNEEKYIGQTLTWATNQSFKDYEIIVVDNASTDNTVAICKKFEEVTVISEAKLGLLNAREAGRIAAKGEVVVYIDADTFIDYEFLGQVYGYFLCNPKVIGLGCPYDFYDGTPLFKFGVKVFFQYWKLVDWYSKIRHKPSFMFGPSFAIKSTALERIGGFNTAIKFYGEDSDTTKRVGKIGRVDFLWKVVTHTSCRRYKRIGIFRTLGIYFINYISVMLFDKPVEGKQ